MKLSLRLMFEALLRGLRLVGLQACEDALTNNRNRIFLKSQPLGDEENELSHKGSGSGGAQPEELEHR